MIAGPNGSGKTTLTNQLRADGVDLGHYVNPDEIAKTLEGAYGARVRGAQQIAADERQACLEAGRSFSFETVMSHPSKIEVLREAKARGFRTALYFVATESPSLNVARVAQRVLLGGHDVPEDRIRQRYVRTLDLLPQALEQAIWRSCSTTLTAPLPFSAHSVKRRGPGSPFRPRFRTGRARRSGAWCPSRVGGGMSALDDLRRQLRPGEVYRRRDLAKGSSALDRHVRRLVVEGHLEKVFHGLYMAPRQSRSGRAPARPEKLIKAFLKDDRFLMMSPSAFNGLGVGTTQLYNESIVYNLRRQGRFELGGLTYDFRRTPSVPSRLNAEVLLVALLLSTHRLAEDRTDLVPRVLERARALNPDRLAQAARDFGSARASRFLRRVLHTR
jgi:predicted ABC-type ATPase